MFKQFCKSALWLILVTMTFSFSIDAKTLNNFKASIASIDDPFFNQVQYCKKHLPVAKLPPAGSCFGENTKEFIEGSQKKRLGYFQLDHNVDAVFHCDSKDVEVIVHNRKTGNTCFFFMPSEKLGTDGSFPSIDSCTGSGCSAGRTWIVGDHTDKNSQCTTCHKHGGPYFIVNSAEAMAYFGLINNGHDTNFEKYFALHFDTHTEKAMNAKIQESNPKFHNTNDPNRPTFPGTCGGACHNYVHKEIKVINGGGGLQNQPFATSKALFNLGIMPPNDPLSPYRWVNRDDAAGTGDHERYTDVQKEYPALAAGCSTPKYMEARVVGSEQIIRSDSNWSKLRAFNPVDGLICKNADFTSGCPDFQVRFQCKTSTSGSLSWTNWQDTDNPSGEGDHERPPSKCLSTPVAIEARISVPAGPTGGAYIYHYGFPDRLQQFDNKGLVCKNADQADGECANYVVRFVCP